MFITNWLVYLQSKIMKQNLFDIQEYNYESKVQEIIFKTKQEDEQPGIADIHLILRQKNDPKGKDLEQNQLKSYREAIAPEVLIIFDSTLRECPPLMSMDRVQKHKIEGELSTYKLKAKVESDSQSERAQRVVQDVGMGFEVAVSPWQQQQILTAEQKINLLRSTLEQARRQNYDRVAFDIFTEKPMENTQQLNFNYHNFTKMIDLSIYSGLKVLKLSHNRFKRITPLGELTQLQHLDLSHNQLAKIQNIGHFCRLRQLYLDYNVISSMVGLEFLGTLQILGLSFNKVTKLESLNFLSSLRKLDAEHNSVAKIQNTQGLLKLQSLNLARNKIDRIENINCLPCLRELILSQNSIKSVSQADLPKGLTILSLVQNPIDSSESRKLLSHLRDLNITVNL